MKWSTRTPNGIPLSESVSVLLQGLQEQGWSIRWSSQEPRDRTEETGPRTNVTILSDDGSKLGLEFEATWIGVEPKLDVRVGSLTCGVDGDTYPVFGALSKELEKRLVDNLTAIKSRQERKDI
jgi:hypothetical protein